MKLIPQWRQAWRMLSVQAMAAALVLQAAWEATPVDLKSSLPPKIVTAVTLALLVLGIVGRIVSQPNLHPPFPPPSGGDAA